MGLWNRWAGENQPADWDSSNSDEPLPDRRKWKIAAHTFVDAFVQFRLGWVTGAEIKQGMNLSDTEVTQALEINTWLETGDNYGEKLAAVGAAIRGLERGYVDHATDQNLVYGRLGITTPDDR